MEKKSGDVRKKNIAERIWSEKKYIDSEKVKKKQWKI